MRIIMNCQKKEAFLGLSYQGLLSGLDYQRRLKTVRSYNTKNNTTNSRDIDIVKSVTNDINYLYNKDKYSSVFPSMTPIIFDSIISDIQNQKYDFSSLLVASFPLKECYNLFSEICLDDYPNIDYQLMIDGERNAESDFLIVRPSNPRDSLVLKALALTLHRLIYGSSPIKSSIIKDRFPSYLEKIKGLNYVNRMYKIDLATSFAGITLKDIQLAAKPYLGEECYILKLIEKILFLDKYEVYENEPGDEFEDDDLFRELRCLIPPVGEFARILFDMVLMRKFDKPFKRSFPNITFYRFQNEVFIPTNSLTQSSFNEEECLEFLNYNDLTGSISSINARSSIPLGAGLDIYSNNYKLFLTECGDIQIEDLNNQVKRNIKKTMIRKMNDKKSLNLVKQLSSDILYVYNNLKEDGYFPSLNPFLLKSLLDEIENEKYMVLPLSSSNIPRNKLLEFRKERWLDYPDVYSEVNSERSSDENLTIIKPSNPKDSLVLLGVSLTLQRLLYGSIPNNCIELQDRFPLLIEVIKDLSMVDRMYKISLDLSVLNEAHALNAVKPYLGDENYLFTLIKAILNHPIIGEKKSIQKDSSKKIQVFGEISRVLHDMVLRDQFDKEFKKTFPKIPFIRYLNEIFIPIELHTETDVSFDEKDILSFLSKIGLSGSISSIRRGFGSLSFGGGVNNLPFGDGLDFDYENILFIMGSGKVKVSSIRDYS